MIWQGYDVGKRVVCICTGESWIAACTIVPQQNKIYTIKATRIGLTVRGETVLGLRFEEFESYSATEEYEPEDGYWWFAAPDFRPVDERRLDVFRQLLKTVPADGVPA